MLGTFIWSSGISPRRLLSHGAERFSWSILGSVARRLSRGVLGHGSQPSRSARVPRL